VEHPQKNVKTEATNKIILNGLKRRLRPAKGNLIKKILKVMWAYQCTPESTTQKTPFSLTYGTKAMILVEVEEPSL